MAAERWSEDAPNSIDLAARLIAKAHVPMPNCADDDPLRMYTAQEILGEGDRDCLYGIFDKGHLCQLFGESSAGKTFVAFDTFVRGAAGMPILGGHPTTEPFRSIYFSVEGTRAFNRRLRAALDHLEVLDNPDVLARIRIVKSVPEMFTDPEAVTKIFALVAKAKAEGFVPDVLWFDTYADLSEGASDDSPSAHQAVGRKLMEVARSCDVAVWDVHHTPISDAERGRGPGSIKAKRDLMVCVTGTSNPRTLKLKKGKDIEPFDDVRLDIAPHERSACVVWHGTVPTKVAIAETNYRRVLTALKALHDQSGCPVSCDAIQKQTGLSGGTVLKHLRAMADDPACIVSACGKLPVLLPDGIRGRCAEHFAYNSAEAHL